MVDVPDISIVVPVYGSDSTLVPLYERVAAAASRIPASFELIFVDDCGPGRPWELINELAQRDPRVIGLKLSKNFGQHRAIMAGVDISRGNWLVIMDCDLQDRPEEIPRLWMKAQEGHDVVVGRRVERQDEFFKRLFSRVLHRIFKYMTDQESDATQANFGIYVRKVVDVVKTLPEQPRVFPLLVRWAGFEITTIDIAHGRRAEGKSSYTLSRKLSLAMNIIVSYSNKPLKMCVQFRFFMVFAAVCFGLGVFISYYLSDYTSVGWTSLTVLLFFLLGILFSGMSILGVYIGRAINQVEGKPLYIVKDRTQVT
jgi:glycosyltransferase involved in cell wall biosynthesis